MKQLLLKASLPTIFAAPALVGFVGAVVNAESNRPARAETGQPSYDLSAFAVQYPFEAHAGDGRVIERWDSAAVAFESTWTIDTYPGEATCYIEVLGSNGEVVGSEEFGLDTYTRVASFGPIKPVAVSAPAASARGYCAEAPQAQGEGVTFTDAAVTAVAGSSSAGSDTGGLRLAATSHWIDGVRPPVQSCTATMTLRDGFTRSVAFNLEAGDGRRFEVVLDEVFAGATNPQITCVDFVG